jgi:hypothetical protein
MVFSQCEKYRGGLGKFTKGFFPNILFNSPCSEALTGGHLF